MKETEQTLKFFYRRQDLIESKNIQNSFLFDSTSFDKISGKILYIFNFLEDIVGNQNAEIETDNTSIFIYNFDKNNNIICADTINFILTTYGKTNNSILINGTDVTFEIISGTGKYLGAEGTVNLNVDLKTGIRTITINIKN